MFKGTSVHMFSMKFWFTSLLSPKSYAYHNFNPVDLITTFYFSSNTSPNAVCWC